MSAIVVDFQIGGLKRVHEAFTSVVKAQQDMEKAVVRSISKEGKAREDGADKARKAREKEYAELFKQLDKKDKAEEKRYNAIVKRLDREVRAVEKADARKTKESEKSAAAEAKNQERRYNAIVKRLDKEVKDVERAENEKAHAREVAAKRAVDFQLRSAKLAGKIAADSVREEAALRKRITGAVAGQVVGSARGAIGTMAGIGGSILALGGGFSVADGVQASVKNSGRAADLSNASGGTVSKASILAKAADVGSMMGTSTEAVIDGMDAFVSKSGDMKAAFAGIQQLMELAAATGADLGELSRTAGIIHMGTGDLGTTMSQMRTLAGAGREGSVDMRELSQYAGRISAGANQFGDKGTAFNQLSAIVQQAAATGGATAAPEATEAVARLSSDIFEREDSFKDLGIKTRDKTGKFLADPMSIIKSAISKTGGDSAQLNGLFGAQSRRAVAGYQDVYNREAQSVLAGGGSKKAADAAGLAAIDKAFRKIADAALTEIQVKEEAAKRLQESDKQLEMVLNQLREAVGRELVPELIKLIPEIRKLIPAFVDMLKHAVAFADWFASNPLTGMGLVVMGAITKDLAAAGIGAAVRSALMALMNGSVPIPTPVPGAGAVGPGLGAGVAGAGGATIAGVSVAGGVIGAGLGYGAVRIASGRQVDTQKGVFGAVDANSAAIQDIKKMAAGPERDAKINALRSKIESDRNAASSAADNAGPGFLTTAIGMATGQGEALLEAQRAEQAAYGKAMKELTGQLERLSKAAGGVPPLPNSPVNDPARNVPPTHPSRN